MAHPELEIYYWKDYQQREGDFVLKDKTPVQQVIHVSYDIENKNTKERERRSILKTMNEFTLKEGSIITESYKEDEEIDGTTIVYKPLWKWLTE